MFRAFMRVAVATQRSVRTPPFWGGRALHPPLLMGARPATKLFSTTSSRAALSEADEELRRQVAELAREIKALREGTEAAEARAEARADKEARARKAAEARADREARARKAAEAKALREAKKAAEAKPRPLGDDFLRDLFAFGQPSKSFPYEDHPIVDRGLVVNQALKTATYMFGMWKDLKTEWSMSSAKDSGFSQFLVASLGAGAGKTAIGGTVYHAVRAAQEGRPIELGRGGGVLEPDVSLSWLKDDIALVVPAYMTMNGGNEDLLEDVGKNASPAVFLAAALAGANLADWGGRHKYDLANGTLSVRQVIKYARKHVWPVGEDAKVLIFAHVDEYQQLDKVLAKDDPLKMEKTIRFRRELTNYTFDGGRSLAIDDNVFLMLLLTGLNSNAAVLDPSGVAAATKLVLPPLRDESTRGLMKWYLMEYQKKKKNEVDAAEIDKALSNEDAEHVIRLTGGVARAANSYLARLVASDEFADRVLRGEDGVWEAIAEASWAKFNHYYKGFVEWIPDAKRLLWHVLAQQPVDKTVVTWDAFVTEWKGRVPSVSPFYLRAMLSCEGAVPGEIKRVLGAEPCNLVPLKRAMDSTNFERAVAVSMLMRYNGLREGKTMCTLGDLFPGAVFDDGHSPVRADTRIVLQREMTFHTESRETAVHAERNEPLGHYFPGEGQQVFAMHRKGAHALDARMELCLKDGSNLLVCIQAKRYATPVRKATLKEALKGMQRQTEGYPGKRAFMLVTNNTVSGDWKESSDVPIIAVTKDGFAEFMPAALI